MGAAGLGFFLVRTPAERPPGDFPNPHIRFKFTPARADPTGMKRAHILTAQYRVALHQRDDRSFVAISVELPDVAVTTDCPDRALRAVRERVAGTLVELLQTGNAPAPLRDSEGRLGAWAADLEILQPVPSAPADLEKPEAETLRAIARSTAERYRLVIESQEEEGFIAACAEVPGLVADGRTVSRAVEALRALLVDHVEALLNANVLPPEALQDVEARRKEKSRGTMTRAA